ncbi:response regulator transcription factor [Teredinibacter turnerae]|uniref:response regulator transcription factor n=1 Tax=Teredinibacter turnerae TaxID=2426 RepID=UPI00036DBE84|nr:response regulator transcription factor [Teredinibacter turnerae]
MAENILVIEDQEEINELIALNLETLNYTVTRALDGDTGLTLSLNTRFDLIILDVMLPGIDGLQICQRLRSAGVLSPILMLTAKKSEADRVVGLEVGADDYLTKPFSVRELQARVRALLRRVAFNTQDTAPAAGPDQLVFGDLSINKNKHVVSVADEEIKLTAKEFDLLLYLASSPGQVFSRDQLLSAVWGYHHSGYEHTVNSHINRLRAKLEPNASEPRYVLTVWGVGYKFYE